SAGESGPGLMQFYERRSRFCEEKLVNSDLFFLPSLFGCLNMRNSVLNQHFHRVPSWNVALCTSGKLRGLLLEDFQVNYVVITRRNRHSDARSEQKIFRKLLTDVFGLLSRVILR